MNEFESRTIFRSVLSGWPTQRQRLTNEDIAEMAVLYVAGLADLDFSAAKAAMIRLVRTSKWMPTVADICEATQVIMHGHRRTGAEAWGDVLKAIRKHGWNHAPGIDFQFDDPIVARVVRALGWSDLCHSEGAMAAADRARFIDSYEQIRDQERADRAATPGLSGPALPEPAKPAQLTPPSPVLSAKARELTLREVIAQALVDNPHLAPELKAIDSAVNDTPGLVWCDHRNCERDDEDICNRCGQRADGPPFAMTPGDPFKGSH